MKRAVITKAGGPEVLSVIESPEPVPGKNEVVIEVHAAGVAFADIIMRRGQYLGMPQFPFTPGYDVFGVVREVGEGVTDFQKGDRVSALTQFGGYAEQAAVNQNRVFKTPDSITPADGAALVLNYITAYQLLTEYAALNENSKILLFSAAGGVGTAVLQLAGAMNLKIVGVCSSEKTPVVEKYGGIAVDYKNSHCREDLIRHAPEGFDLVLDPIGGEHLDMSIGLVKKGGVLAGFGFFSAFRGDEMTGKARDTILQFLKLKFFQFSKKVRFYSINPDNGKKNKWIMAKIMNFYEQGKIKPLIGSVFKLDEVQEAHKRLSGGKNTGKIILQCR